MHSVPCFGIRGRLSCFAAVKKCACSFFGRRVIRYNGDNVSICDSWKLDSAVAQAQLDGAEIHLQYLNPSPWQSAHPCPILNIPNKVPISWGRIVVGGGEIYGEGSRRSHADRLSVNTACHLSRRRQNPWRSLRCTHLRLVGNEGMEQIEAIVVSW